MFARLSLHPMRRSDHHHERRMVPRHRHRHEHPFMHHPNIVKKSHRKGTLPNLNTHTRVANRNRQGIPANVVADMLKYHNDYRARHCAQPLTISEELNKIAQAYAERLAATSRFEHSGNKLRNEPLGENLYMQSISFGPVNVNAQAAAKSWYDEISQYNFKRPGFSMATGHFTQLVWKDTKQLGVGVALSPNKQKVYFVTNYYPAGNVSNPGFFERNVLPTSCKRFY